MIKTTRPTPGLDDYAYINARIKVMRTEFISNERLRDMMLCTDIMGVMEILKGTCYKAEIKECEATGKITNPLKVIEVATERNVINTISRIDYFTAGKPKELFHTFVSKYDLDNLKSIMRGICCKLPSEEIISCLVHMGSSPEGLLWELAKEETIRGFISRLKEKGVLCYRALEQAYGKYDATSNLLILELALDNDYYQKILEGFAADGDESDSSVRDMFRREIDIVNAMNVLRITREKPEGIRPDDFLIAGGLRITKSVYKMLVASKNVRDVLKELESLGFKSEVASRLELYSKTNDISVFERGFQEALERHTKKGLSYDSLGIGVMLSYIRAKLSEVSNIRVIARSVDFGMPEDIIKGELIIV